VRIVSLPAAGAVLATTLIGCAAQHGPESVVSSTQGTSIVRTAQVTNVRDVTMSGEASTGAGSLIGSVLGGIAGSSIGSGHGSTVASIGGAVAGGAAGHAVQKSAATTKATELTVRFANGDVDTYNVDPAETFRIGDTVKVITTQGKTRITH
jgi:outer membrane lipoprotein SlyB